jgi:succinate dehydrogenase/fumarate reductase flavoprotein subunit
MTSTKVDLLVLGAGMTGLAAAARTVEGGGSVILVEKDDTVGGSANYAEFIWTAPTLEVLRKVNPDGDPALAEVLIGDLQGSMDWVRSLGVLTKPPVDLLGFGRGQSTDLADLFRTEERMVREAPGSEVLLGADPVRLLIEDGVVGGAEISLASGEKRTVEATSTLLAMGGFGGDEALRVAHIGEQTAGMQLRANPNSAGRGLELGLSAGAAFGAEGAGFYGHLMASQVPVKEPHMFVAMTFYHSEHGVLINLRGERFIDETAGDHLNTIALVDQPEARCLLIYDERCHRDWMMKPYVEGLEPNNKFDLAYKAGARCAIAHDLEEFKDLPPEWGYPAGAVHDRILEFNRQAESGDFDPPRSRDPLPLAEPPFYVIEMMPAMTFTFGGVLIDTEARAVREDGKPIPGLLAAGADAGGLYNGAYAGGLAAALVFGLRAARTALAATSR